MADTIFTRIKRVDLNRQIVRCDGGTIGLHDNKANRYGAEIVRDGQSVSLSGCSVQGYFIRPNNDTVVITGKVDGNTAYVDLSEACYKFDGAYSLAIKIAGSGFSQTVIVYDGHVALTRTDSFVDDGALLSIEELLAQIAAMETATASATAAAQEARDAAAETEAATQAMQEQMDAHRAEVAGVLTAFDRNKSPSIVCTEQGGVIALADASDLPLHGLRIFGRTTQDGTPSPDNPVELVSVGDGGTIGVTVAGKNLLNADGLSWFAALPTVPDSVKFPLKLASGKYRLTSASSSGIRRQNVISVTLKDAEGTTVQNINVSTNNALNDTSVFSLIEEEAQRIARIDFYYNASNDTARVDGERLTELQIASAFFEDAYYESYKGTSITLTTPNGLPGIPVSSGGNYTDADGQQWICDEIDFGRGMYVQRIQRISINKLKSAGADNDALFTYVYEFATDGYPNGTSELRDVRCISDMFAPYVVGNNGVSADKMGENTISSSTRYVVMKFPAGTTLDDANALLVENPATAQYILEKSIETALTVDELNAYAALHTNKLNTTIYNDAGAWQEVSYAADTKTYIDNQIAAAVALALNG